MECSRNKYKILWEKPKIDWIEAERTILKQVKRGIRWGLINGKYFAEKIVSKDFFTAKDIVLVLMSIDDVSFRPLAKIGRAD